MRHKRFNADFGGVTVPCITKLLGVASTNVLGEWFAGASDTGYLRDISGNARHLAATAAPPITQSSLVGADGNQLQAFSYNGSSQNHTLASAPWMSCLTSSHAFVFVVRLNTTGAGTDYIFGRGLEGTNGLTVKVDGTNVTATWSRAGGSTTATAALTRDGLYHVVTVVKNGTSGMVYVDGASGAVATLNAADGADSSEDLFIGSYRGPASYLDGQVVYWRWQNTVETFSQIQKELALWQGIAPGIGGLRLAMPTFQRSTASYASRKTGSQALVQVPANWPAKTNGGAVLIQGSVTQLFTYTEAFSNAAWTKSSSSITADSAVAPNGATTADTFVEGAAGDGDVEHSLYPTTDPTITASASYGQSWHVQYIASGREWVYLRNVDANKNAWFNIRYGYVGTVSSGVTTKIEPVPGWGYRIFAGCTSSTTTDTWKLCAAEADNDLTYTGDARNAFYIWGAQLESGLFPTVYVPRLDATAASRSADSLTYIPWRISKNLAQHVNATPRLQFLGSESLNGSTVTPTIGSYSFTKNGRPQNGENVEEGAHFRFNGSTDYLSLTNADFSPASYASWVFSFTPSTVSGTGLLFYNSGSMQIYQNGSGISVTTSDGSSATVTKTSCLEIGKPVLCSVVLTKGTGATDNTVNIYVDSMTVATSSVMRYPSAGTNVRIGNSSGSEYLNGKLHYLAYMDNYVVSASEHQAMYAAFKQPGFLNLDYSASTDKTKIHIEFEAKCLYSSLSNIGASRTLISIGGNTGAGTETAASNKNLIQIKAHTDGKFYAEFYEDSDTTQRFIPSGVRTDLNQWHKHVFTLDLANSANSTYTIDGIAQTLDASMTGTGNVLNLRNCLIRVAQSQASTANGFCEIRGVKVSHT